MDGDGSLVPMDVRGNASLAKKLVEALDFSRVSVYTSVSCGGLAQLVARLNGIEKVSGSNPLTSISKKRSPDLFQAGVFVSVRLRRIFKLPIGTEFSTFARFQWQKWAEKLHLVVAKFAQLARSASEPLFPAHG